MAKRRYSHSNPNYDFLQDIENDRSPLEDPTRELLATSIQRAHNSGVQNPGEQPLYLSPGLKKQFPGGMPGTIHEAQNALLKSFYPQMLTYASRMENTNVGMGDLMSEMTVGFNDTIQGWDPNKGSLLNHVTNSLKNTAGAAVKGYTPLGMSIDAGSTATGFGGIVNGPDPDRGIANNDFSGTTAAYSMPTKEPWYRNVAKATAGSTIPTPFYAPDGQSLFTRDENGRQVINPRASTSPRGGVQLSVTGEDLAGYSKTLDTYYATPKDARELDFGQPQQVKSLNKFLRGLGGQIGGNEFISTDAEVLGSVAGVEDTFLRTHKGTASVLIDDNAKPGFIANVRAGKVGAVLTPTGVTVDADPVEFEPPINTVAKATRNALDSFDSPTEQLMKSAAEETEILGRLGPRKVNRWKDETTEREEYLARRAKKNGQEYENPETAKNQTKAWSNSKRAVEAHANSPEAITESIMNDASIPDEFKQQAIDNAVEGPSTRSFGKYGSQAEEPAFEEPPMPEEWSKEKPTQNMDEPASAATVQRLALSTPSEDGVPDRLVGKPAAEVPAATAASTPSVAPAASSAPAPVSGVGNTPPPGPSITDGLAQVATAATVQRLETPAIPASDRARAAFETATRSRAALEQEFPEFVRDHLGRGKENKKAFTAYREGLGDRQARFEELHSGVQAERKFAAAVNGQSVYTQMVEQNGGWKGEKPASSSPAGTPPPAGSLPPSSNGAGGGGGNNIPPTTTSSPDPGEDPNEIWRKHANIKSQQADPAAIASAQNIAENPDYTVGAERVRTQRDSIQEERLNSQNERIRNIPMSARETKELTAAARSSMMTQGNPYRDGSYHGTYGNYQQADPDNAEAGGNFVSPASGNQTISNKTIQTGKGIYEAAVNQAFDQPGMEGLTNREFAATIHKRVQEGIGKIVDNTVQEMVKASPEGAENAKNMGQQLRTVAGDMLSQGDAALREMSGSSRIGDTNASARRIHGKELKSAVEQNPDLKERVDELGGVDDVSRGPRRVLIAGDQSYSVGAADGGFGGGGGGGHKGISSIYSSNFGHAMMAQFMASMAWKSTGGAVMESAQKFSDQQAAYIPMANFGSGEVGVETMASSRQEMSANRMGAMAYEQYGFLNEMGYMATSMPQGQNIARFGNDLKMTAGAAAVAGVGTWGVGALTGSAALTAAAAPVAGAVAAAVAIPSIGFSAYNALTGQDSYEGAGWKNAISGQVLKSAEFQQDFWGSMASTGGGFLGGLQNIAFSDGSYQDDYTKEHYGKDAKEYVQGSKIGQALGAEAVNWLFAGREEGAAERRELVEGIQQSTGLKEDVVAKQLTGIQVAFGGLDTEEKREDAKFISERAADLGVDTSQLLSDAGNMASQRGILAGTEEFQALAKSYAGMSQVDQQKEMLRSSRAAQQYSQFAPYVEGGMGEAYNLHTELGVSTMGETQAISSAFSQAQMSGMNLTPGAAQRIAEQSMTLTPGQSLDASRMASQFTQMGTGNFGSNFSTLAQSISSASFGVSAQEGSNQANLNIAAAGEGVVGNEMQTSNFIQGVASGNAYALSDYGRMAGIGVFQSMDQQGLKTGLKDMSGLLSYAQQNMLPEGSQSLTGSQTLSQLGLSFSSTSEQSMLQGGIWGYQASYAQQGNALQAQGLNLQGQQIQANRNFMYQSWGIEDQTMSEQWSAQQMNFAHSNTMMDVQFSHRMEDMNANQDRFNAGNNQQRSMRDFDYQTSLIRREDQQEDRQYSAQMRSLQVGWGMEDINEQIRRSSGYDRSMLVKQRDRMTLSNNLEGGQIERQNERQDEMWAREDERYSKGVEFSEQMIEMDQTRMDRQRTQAEEIYALQKGHLADEIESATTLHDLRMEMETLQRERQEEQLRHSEAALNLQREMQNLQNEYAENMRIIGNTQSEMEASLRKITSYSPAFSRMLTDFLGFLQASTTMPAPSTNSSPRNIR